jgi:hypothetical protein
LKQQTQPQPSVRIPESSVAAHVSHAIAAELVIEHYSDDEVGVASDADALERQVAQSSHGLCDGWVVGKLVAWLRSRIFHPVFLPEPAPSCGADLL